MSPSTAAGRSSRAGERQSGNDGIGVRRFCSSSCQLAGSEALPWMFREEVLSRAHQPRRCVVRGRSMCPNFQQSALHSLRLRISTTFRACFHMIPASGLSAFSAEPREKAGLSPRDRPITPNIQSVDLTIRHVQRRVNKNCRGLDIPNALQRCTCCAMRHMV